ncbi:hypothetical protein OU798_06830 [Prolixibacteraceae bacterium Z1-6]|uniref:Uncharacterized protein n=1 Tax=Draconibacterium aestuarii TaxID=2998507 RepID=A0A9X3F3U8_9BACT|nr:hypothetical protein [Prolixibacteraceae bacterium Z1-6]
MNISGNWTYSEDFEYGNSAGEVKITQTGNNVSAVFTFTEKVENDYEIDVIEKVQGTITDGNILLESTAVKATQDNKEIEYIPNTFEIHRISGTKIIGSSYDHDNVCGVFVLERIK